MLQPLHGMHGDSKVSNEGQGDASKAQVAL
jgi:hypothetical protein